jgi:hypothetical protein
MFNTFRIKKNKERCPISEYTIIDVNFNDPESIKSALTELGYHFEEHKVAQKLYGYAGDVRGQKAHIIVRKKYVGAAANDVGFFRRADGSYEMIISEFDKSGTKKQAVDFTLKIKQLYGKHLAIKHCKRMGLKISSQKVTEDNKIKIRLRA